jgi:serine/threonine protein kinase
VICGSASPARKSILQHAAHSNTAGTRAWPAAPSSTPASSGRSAAAGWAADLDRLARFRREAQAIAAPNHPNVVTAYSVEDANGVHVLTTELVEGETLSARLRPGGLPLSELRSLALPLCAA